MSEPPSPAAEEANEGSAASWNKVEEHVIPQNRMGIVFFGLMCTTFLVALDSVRSNCIILFVNIWLTYHKTIVTTALPTIVAELGGGKNYSWVGR
jgi:hypothetical protein